MENPKDRKILGVFHWVDSIGWTRGTVVPARFPPPRSAFWQRRLSGEQPGFGAIALQAVSPARRRSSKSPVSLQRRMAAGLPVLELDQRRQKRAHLAQGAGTDTWNRRHSGHTCNAPECRGSRNSTEQAFSELEAHFRQIGARTFAELFDTPREIGGMAAPRKGWNRLRAAG